MFTSEGVQILMVSLVKIHLILLYKHQIIFQDKTIGSCCVTDSLNHLT